MVDEPQGADASDMAATESKREAVADAVAASQPQLMLLDDRIVGPHFEITNPLHGVQIQVNDKRVWVNVDGICRVRISGAHQIEVEVDGLKVARR